MAGTSKVAASPTGSGNCVMPWLATPCSDSLHQSYAGTFRRGMARAWFTSWLAFSSSVILLPSAAPLFSGKRLVSSHVGFWASWAANHIEPQQRDDAAEAFR